ncbi:MAG: HD domain-containing protein [Candidatus Nealsonbacteria bacterium]|nr:MAG: HD domain-containing protein [Candidatus Nealsonbacteria bacterium]
MKKKKNVKQKFSLEKIEKLVNFLLEFRILKHLPRASLSYLKGPLKENVAEHSFYTAIIGWILAKLETANENKILKMCLIRNLVKARGGERNLINKFYSQPLNDPKIIEEISKNYQLEEFSLEKLFKEFYAEKTLEAKLVKDADILAGMLLEKEGFNLGNQKAKKWLTVSLNRLKTKKARQFGEQLIKTDSDEWWLELVNKYVLETKFL